MASEVGLRERKKIALREQLIATATRLFMENGFAETTLEQVAQENMVSNRTLLRHFESKEGLAIASVRLRAAEFRAQIEDPNRTLDTIAIWRQALLENSGRYADSPKLREYHEFLTSEPQLIGILASVHDEYADVVAKGLAADEDIDPKNNLDNEVFAAMLVQSYRVVLQHWINNKRSGDLRGLALKVMEAIVRQYPDRSRPGYITRRKRAG